MAMTETQIAIKEEINCLRAKQRKYYLKEHDYAIRAKFCITVQAELEDDIMVLEHDLAKAKVLEGI
jgi:hypothetical protein